MSLSSRIIIRLSVTIAVATAASYGWLYIKQSRVESYLHQRTLVRQAQEVSSFISIAADGSVDLDLPSKLLEAYNSPGSRYRYAVRDEAGRIVATSGRRVGPLPSLMATQDRNVYEYGGDVENAKMMGAAIRTDIGQRTFFTQVEQTLPMTQSLNAAVFNEFFMDGGWLQNSTPSRPSRNKRIDGKEISVATQTIGNACGQNRPRNLHFATTLCGSTEGNPPTREFFQQSPRQAR